MTTIKFDGCFIMFKYVIIYNCNEYNANILDTIEDLFLKNYISFKYSYPRIIKSDKFIFNKKIIFCM